MLDYKNPELRLHPSTFKAGQVAWRSPSNIALIKYWGKHGRQLPRNPSISFTLQNACTETLIKYELKEKESTGIELDFLFHQDPNEAFRAKMVKFLASITDIFPFLEQLKLSVQSGNSFPHSAGIASSASSMSALALCLCTIEDNLFSTLGDDKAFEQKASFVARLGSGSACRSIYSSLAAWGETPLLDGSSDLFAVPFQESHAIFQSFQDDIMLVSQSEKSVSSRAGHALMEDNPFAPARYQQAKDRMATLLDAMRSGDLETFGEIVEDEALSLHALMMASKPSYMLMEPATVEMIKQIRAYRADTGHPVYFSLDAGPNIHLLYPQEVIHEVRPWVDEVLAPLCEQQSYLADFVGEGPEEI
ncbi:MAG: diphosphomevalonate decarboxylase [Bacteroidota bacterium]